MVIRPVLNAIVCVGINILCYFSLNFYEKISVWSFLAMQVIVVLFIFIFDKVSMAIDNKDNVAHQIAEDLIAGNYYTIDYSDEETMLQAVEQAIKNNEWVIMTGWQPHYKFLVYDLKFLEDPKGCLARKSILQHWLEKT